MDGDGAMLYLEQNPQFDLILDREWYNMVGAPLERVCDLSGTILMLAGRKRETGVLLSMGEAWAKSSLRWCWGRCSQCWLLPRGRYVFSWHGRFPLHLG